MTNIILDFIICILITFLKIVESIGLGLLLKLDSVLLVLITLYNLFKILIKYKFKNLKITIFDNRYTFLYLVINYFLIFVYILVLENTDVYLFLQSFFETNSLSEFMHAILIFLCLFILIDQILNLLEVTLKPLELFFVDWDKKVAINNIKANMFEISFEIIFTIFLIIILKFFSNPLIVMILASVGRYLNYHLKKEFGIENINVRDELDLLKEEWYNRSVK